jgi:diguanylate cyclase (GGDEF)-like protein
MRATAPATDHDLALQCVLDTAARATVGTYTYPGLWLAVILSTDAGSTWPWMAWGNAVGLTLLALLRTAYTLRLPKLLRLYPQQAEWGFNAQYLVNAFYWSCLVANCIIVAPLQPMTWLLLLGTGCMMAAANTMLGFNPALRLPYLIAILAPLMITEGLHPLPLHLVLIGLQSIFAAYLARTSMLVHQDYWDGRHARRLAEQQAQELELASLTDGLTQIPNRMHFDRQLRHEWSRHGRSGGPLSLLLIDLDHFKNINDSFGHPFGDTCLKAAAKALQEGCGRCGDFVARYGGEEFVVLLPHTDATGAQTIAQHMLHQLRQLALDSDGLEVRVTCSIGVASTIPCHSERATELVRRADEALYAAKHQGRNRVVLATEPGSTKAPTP